MGAPLPSGALYLGMAGEKRTGRSFFPSFRSFELCDDALAAGRADADRAAPRAALVQRLGEAGDDAPAGGGKGVSGSERAAVDVELRPVDLAQGLLAPEAITAEALVLPGAQRAEHLGGE